MRKIAGIIVAVLLASAGPNLARANDVRDGDDCNHSDQSFIDANPANGVSNPNDIDRGAVCVRANGTTVFYLGGELQADEKDNQGHAGGGTSQFDHGACGAFTMAFVGTYGSGHENRNRNNPGGHDPGPYPGSQATNAERDANWDFMHSHGPGPDSIWRTDDDQWHHHHCD